MMGSVLQMCESLLTQTKVKRTCGAMHLLRVQAKKLQKCRRWKVRWGGGGVHRYEKSNDYLLCRTP